MKNNELSGCDRVHSSIEAFYRAFADVARPARIDGCPCCITAEELDSLVDTPLREITADELGTYAAGAFLTIGDVDDYLYLLPRIIEISVNDESWWPSFEVTARAIASAGLDGWPENRKLALTQLLGDVIRCLVETESHDRIDEWMCGIGRMELNVWPFLSIIEENENAVIEYWKSNAGKLDQNKLGNAFWDPPTRQHDEIVRWFRSPKINAIYAREYGYRMD